MRILGALTFTALCIAGAFADESVFSGPQPGEKMPAFEAVLVLGEDAGKSLDLVSEAKEAPLMVVFVHELTRPSIGLTRLVANYASTRRPDGLRCGIVFLSDDVSEMEARVKRAQHALPKNVPIGVSPDGKEGPGAYGLNRKVTLTVLVANQGRVTANFALVQPSVAADAVRIGSAIAKVLGDEKEPSLAEMSPDRPGERMAEGISDARFRELLGPVIQKTATADEVRAAAARVEALAKSNAAFKSRLGSVAHRIIDAGRLENYGTETAQEYLQKWAREYHE